MKKKAGKQNRKPSTEADGLEALQYPANEDIYAKDEKIAALVEEVFEKKSRNKIRLIGEDLDVPGAELDDKEEAIGEEDEENNYYSLGGDNHNDLDEQHDA